MSFTLFPFKRYDYYSEKISLTLSEILSGSGFNNEDSEIGIIAFMIITLDRGDKS